MCFVNLRILINGKYAPAFHSHNSAKITVTKIRSNFADGFQCHTVVGGRVVWFAEISYPIPLLINIGAHKPRRLLLCWMSPELLMVCTAIPPPPRGGLPFSPTQLSAKSSSFPFVCFSDEHRRSCWCIPGSSSWWISNGSISERYVFKLRLKVGPNWFPVQDAVLGIISRRKENRNNIRWLKYTSTSRWHLRAIQEEKWKPGNRLFLAGLWSSFNLYWAHNVTALIDFLRHYFSPLSCRSCVGGRVTIKLWELCNQSSLVPVQKLLLNTWSSGGFHRRRRQWRMVCAWIDLLKMSLRDILMCGCVVGVAQGRWYRQY